MFSVWKGPSQNLTSLSHLQTTVTSTEEVTGPRALGISAEDRAGTLQSCRPNLHPTAFPLAGDPRFSLPQPCSPAPPLAP